MKERKVKSIDNTFGQRLKDIRKSLKLTQIDFADKMNISVTNLSDIENGKTHPCHDFFYRILKEFKINLNYCLSGDYIKSRNPNKSVKKKMLIYMKYSSIICFYMAGNFKRTLFHDEYFILNEIEDNKIKLEKK